MYFFFFFDKTLDYLCLEYTTVAHSTLNKSILAINILLYRIGGRNKALNAHRPNITFQLKILRNWPTN